MMKITRNINFQNLFDNQESILLFFIIITTIILIGLIVLLLRNFLCWYFRINEISKRVNSVDSSIQDLSYKIDYLTKINSTKKNIPSNYIKFDPVKPQDKKVSNSKFGAINQIRNKPKREKKVDKESPIENNDDDLLAKAIESNR